MNGFVWSIGITHVNFRLGLVNTVRCVHGSDQLFPTLLKYVNYEGSWCIETELLFKKMPPYYSSLVILKKNNLCSNLPNFVIFEEFWGQLQWTWLLSRLNSQVLCTNTNTTRISVTLHRCLRHTPAPFAVQTWREIQDRIPILRNSWIGQKAKNPKILKSILG